MLCFAIGRAVMTAHVVMSCSAPACIRSPVRPPAVSCVAVSSVLSTYGQE